MSRSGYVDDGDNWGLIRWRGAVASAIRGRRGQAFFAELLLALDAMPERRLIDNALKADGGFCTIGVIGAARGLDMSKINPDDPEEVSRMFDIAEALAQEVAYMNDEDVPWFKEESPEERFVRMRKWVAMKIKVPL
jgi:hypothetical protein